VAGPGDMLETYLGISHETPEGDVLRLLVELGAQFVGAREGSLLVLDEDKGELVFAMTVGDQASEERLRGKRVPLGEGITGLAAQTHEVQIGAATFDVDQPAEPESVLAAPMLTGERLIGVITAVSFEADKRFTNDDAMLYGRVAAVAGLVVEQRRRLAVIEAMQEGAEPPAPVSEDERLDREIVETVMRIVRSKPQAKARIARMLSDIERLTGD